MPLFNDIAHSLAREYQERAAAAAAADSTARIAHAQLADRYADRAWSAQEELDCAAREAC